MFFPLLHRHFNTFFYYFWVNGYSFVMDLKRFGRIQAPMAKVGDFSSTSCGTTALKPLFAIQCATNIETADLCMCRGNT